MRELTRRYNQFKGEFEIPPIYRSIENAEISLYIQIEFFHGGERDEVTILPWDRINLNIYGQ